MSRSAKNSARRRQPTQGRARETVNAILDAVIRLLRRNSVSAITTNRVAAVAGVSIGSVYQYFPNKRAIFIALHERHIEQVDRTLQRKIGESAGKPLDHLVAHLMDGMIEVHAAVPALATLLDSEVPHRADRAGDFSIRLHQPLREALEPHDTHRKWAGPQSWICGRFFSPICWKPSATPLCCGGHVGCRSETQESRPAGRSSRASSPNRDLEQRGSRPSSWRSTVAEQSSHPERSGRGNAG
jgi:AcrR family transcriptional regulator